MDDFGGDYLIGPIHDEAKTHVTGGPVILKQFTQIGTHCVVFPNLTIGEGSVIGAMTLVNKDIPEWCVYIGQPAHFLKKRKQGLLDLV
jgi:galactoside O-acetyltransferase